LASVARGERRRCDNGGGWQVTCLRKHATASGYARQRYGVSCLFNTVISCLNAVPRLAAAMACQMQLDGARMAAVFAKIGDNAAWRVATNA